MSRYLLVLCIAAAGIVAYSAGCGGDGKKPELPSGDGTATGDGGINGGCASEACGTSKVCVAANVTVPAPTAAAVAYEEKGPAKGDPNIACVTTPATAPTTFDKVTVTGCVDVFGLASNTVDLEVTYYEDGNLGTPIAGPIVAVDNVECESSGYHEVEGIPTNTLLVRKVACPAATPDCGFKDSWQFNIYLDSATAVGGVISEANNDDAIANVVSEATWLLIPRTVGLSSGVKKGYGVAAGRIRDCNHDPVMNAMVGMSVAPELLAYFNGAEGTLDDQGNEKASDPDPARTTTNSDGLYAAVNLAPTTSEVACQNDANCSEAGLGFTCDPTTCKCVRWVTIAADAQVGGARQSLGKYAVAVFPDSITILSFKGARPVAQK